MSNRSCCHKSYTDSRSRSSPSVSRRIGIPVHLQALRPAPSPRLRWSLHAAVGPASVIQTEVPARLSGSAVRASGIMLPRLLCSVVSTLPAERRMCLWTRPHNLGDRVSPNGDAVSDNPDAAICVERARNRTESPLSCRRPDLRWLVPLGSIRATVSESCSDRRTAFERRCPADQLASEVPRDCWSKARLVTSTVHRDQWVWRDLGVSAAPVLW
jgi:hypothetical protein